MAWHGIGPNVRRAFVLAAIALGSACGGKQDQPVEEGNPAPAANARSSAEPSRAPGGMPRSAPVLGNDVPDVEASAYMEANGVSLEVARERLLIESELMPHVQDLRERYRERMAFISIESTPYQHLVVGLKGPATEPVQLIRVRGTDVRVEFEQGYPYTAQEFSDIMSKASARALEFFPDVTGLSGRPELGLIEVMVSGTDEQRYLTAKAELEAVAGIEIKILLGRSPPRDLIDIPN